MEIKHIDEIDKATRQGHGELLRLGTTMLFVVGVMLYAAVKGGPDGGVLLVIAAVLGSYMAMNIGANDVANNVGPAVGAHALTLVGALGLAVVFEAAGALIAGGDVIVTIRSGIISPAHIGDSDTMVWVMMAALLAGGLWINVATAFGMPVSTTHSIVGAVLGSGVAAVGTDIVNWPVVGTIVASWVVSPVLAGAFAALFLYLIKRRITYQADMVAAARRTLPGLVAFMAWSFWTFLLMKGFGSVWAAGFPVAAGSGILVAGPVFFLVQRGLSRPAYIIANTKSGVNRLFNLPLSFAAALLCFAHGSNDVANAVGPLASIIDSLARGGAPVSPMTPIPFWALTIGALGLCVGLALFGPRVIRTLGEEITELDQMRAFSVALSAAVTVITASVLGLPVSSTHIAVGAVIGVGLLREYLKGQHERMIVYMKAQHPEADQAAIEDFLRRFEPASVAEKKALLADLKARSKQNMDPANFSKRERKELREVYRKELVTRKQLMRIAVAWLLTVPLSALFSAAFFFVMRRVAL
ncbi:inorganic phosphate transporter [Aromatoleum toluvorans]|uniref:Phosphate transporter n=1 Tax=Aromatoleum toluvorans TaxID=92002 RepID=A0ABX1PVP8_9RHOO|nr:inorganic phosphate transporter [Aromatoleum toluvorans]NMG42762.1 inorganic phosphate transporter [Aromatoleum toluvorans]